MHRSARYSAVGWLTGALVAVGLPGVAVAAPQRAYEQVSAVQKGSNDVNPLNTVQTSPDGSRVLYSAPNGFPGAPSSTIQSYYLAERSATQWSTLDVDPPLANIRSQIFQPTAAATTDLQTIFQASPLALTPAAVEGEDGVYLRDTTTGARSLLANGPAPLFESFTGGGAQPFAGATPDFRQVLLQSPVRLDDDAVQFAGNVYELNAGGTLRLVSLLPDGTADPAGSTSRAPVALQAHGPISDDGSRIVFTGGTTGGIFLRENGGTARPITVSQRTGDPDTSPKTALFTSMTADGRYVFFLSFYQLTDQPTAAYTSLYRYDVDAGTLLNLTPTTSAAIDANVTRVLSVTDSGSDAYFVSRAELAPGGADGTPSVYHWNVDDGIEFVAALDPLTEYQQPVTWSMSASGRYFAFSSFAPVTGYDNTAATCRRTADGNAEGTCSEVYRFDADTGDVDCASCNPAGPPVSHARLGEQNALISNYWSRRVLDDGQVFFNTRDALDARDTNGAIDVYAYDGTAASLISTGTGSGASTFADATPDGSSVYFFTDEQLVAQDNDHAIDVYAARVGGGLPQQNQRSAPPANCLGDGCQGEGVPAPAPPVVGSVSFVDEGNLPDPPFVRAAAKISARKTVKGSAFALTVKTPASGTVAVSGARVTRVSKRVSKAGSYRLTIRLNSKARKMLKKRRKLAAKVRVSYTPENGRVSAKTLTVTLKAR